MRSVEDSMARGTVVLKIRRRIAQQAPVGDAARSHRGIRLRRLYRRRPPRRGKGRAKERIFSFRDEFGQWDRRISVRNSGICTTRSFTGGENIRSFRSRTGPSSTSGKYIERENLEPPSIYYAHTRPVGAGPAVPAGDRHQRPATNLPEDKVELDLQVPPAPSATSVQSAPVESAADIAKIIGERPPPPPSPNAAPRAPRRPDVEASMEQRKKEGYF